MTRLHHDALLRRATTITTAGTFTCLAVIGLLLFGPRVPASHQVRVEPSAKIGLRAAALMGEVPR